MWSSNSVRSVPFMPSSKARISAFLSSRHALSSSFLRSAVARGVVQDFFKNVIFPTYGIAALLRSISPDASTKNGSAKTLPRGAVQHDPSRYVHVACFR